ncbi:2Fe-2S iron-sulfur cluster-binding protein [Azospirillum doebereinerae]
MSRIRLHPSGRTVDCRDGETVLSALEQAGYALPNNCRAGACGECKVKVLEGRFDQGMVLDMALSRSERADGYGLMCMAKPISDELVIEFGTADAKPKLFPPRENAPFVVTDRIPRTPRIVELRLRPLGQPLRYWPGQYVMLGDARAGATPRCYSIANAPRPDGEIVLQVTRIDGGPTSNWIHDRLAVGAAVSLSGPYGTFIGDPSVDSPVLCLAAGSGLAPILALTDAALRRGYRPPVTLLVSAATKADLYEQGLLSYWQAKHRNVTVRTTLTREPEDEPGHALTGRIPAILPGLFPDLSDHAVFVAGSPAFVENCVAAVRALGARDDRIHSEGYVSQHIPETPPPERLMAAVMA